MVEEREALIASLIEYRDTTGESALVDRFLDLIQNFTAAAHRTTFPGHLTGSAWVVNAANDAALLLHHRKLGRWLQPGGHADGDFNLRRVAEREVAEETGIAGLQLLRPGIYDLDIHEIPKRGAEPEHLHYDIRFAFTAPATAEISANHESLSVRWIPFAEFDYLPLDNSVRRLLTRHLAATPHRERGHPGRPVAELATK